MEVGDLLGTTLRERLGDESADEMNLWVPLETF
jgi:hypothetical protein